MKEYKAGFLLLELLVYLGILAISISILFVSSKSWLTSYYKVQLQIASQLLAADLRRLQTQVMFRHNSNTFQLIPTSNLKGYTVSNEALPKVLFRRNFSQSYCSGVHFRNSLVLSFASSGSPATTGTLILYHEKLPQHSIQVELQPITGRVLVNEN